MEEKLKKYDKIISLGSNCYVKFFLKHIKYDQETYFFDNIGSPMWSVCELIKHNFEDVLNFNDYNSEIINKGCARIVTNTKYNLKFKHDLRDLRAGCDGVEFVKFKVEAQGLGYLSVSEFTFRDVRVKWQRPPNRYRTTR